jgi:hypothetical protein
MAFLPISSGSSEVAGVKNSSEKLRDILDIKIKMSPSLAKKLLEEGRLPKNVEVLGDLILVGQNIYDIPDGTMRVTVCTRVLIFRLRALEKASKKKFQKRKSLRRKITGDDLMARDFDKLDDLVNTDIRLSSRQAKDLALAGKLSNRFTGHWN